MGTREILTLQFGHYANFIGTHWWNIQESGFQYHPNAVSEINHDVLFREGVTEKREVTFTPRLLCVDLKGSLKGLPVEGELYNPVQKPEASELFWDENKVEVNEASVEEKCDFQRDLASASNVEEVLKREYNFDKENTVWSDFLYTRFHPRTVNIIKEYEQKNANTPFEVFPLGSNVWNSQDFEDDFCDKIRNYVEECDSFQGFHLLTDCTNSFSGFSSSCLDYLQDEYDRKSVLVLPVIPSHFPDNDYETEEERHQSILNDSVRVLNIALSFNSYAEKSSLFVPLCTGEKGWRQPGQKRNFYHTDYNHKLPYHSSAILASALDTFTLKHRLKTSGFSLIDLCADLTASGRKCASASVCFPFSINADADFIDCLDNWNGPLSKSITPNCEVGDKRVMQHITLRGIPESKLKKPANTAGKQLDMPAYKCKSVREMLAYYLSCTTYASATHVTTVDNPLSIKTPFPRIFDQVLNIDGYVTNKPQPSPPENIPVLAGLHNGSEIGLMLENLHTEVKKIKFKKFHSFTSAGMENDDFVECLDNLFDLRENYEDNYYL